MTELQALIDLTQRASKSIIEDRDLEHGPIVFAITPDNVAVFAIPENLGKEMWCNAIEAILKFTQSYAYIFVAEMLKITSGMVGDVLSGKRNISDIPLDDMGECLTIIAIENGGLPCVLHAPIRYTPEGRRVGEWIESPLLMDMQWSLSPMKW